MTRADDAWVDATENEVRRREALLNGLVHGHERLYLESPTFHNAADYLARALGPLADLIAAGAEHERELANAAARRLAEEPRPSPTITTCEHGTPVGWSCRGCGDGLSRPARPASSTDREDTTP